MGINAFTKTGNTVTFLAATSAPTPVQASSTTLGGNQYRVINAGTVTVFLGYGATAADATANAANVTSSQAIGFSEDMLNIGWQRGYYCCPLAENWREYLLGKTDTPKWKEYAQPDLIEYWKEKWVLPRIDSLKTKLAATILI